MVAFKQSLSRPTPCSRFIVPHSPKSTWWQIEYCAMPDQRRSKLFIGNPIGNGLNGFRVTSILICEIEARDDTDDAV